MADGCDHWIEVDWNALDGLDELNHIDWTGRMKSNKAP